MNVNTVQLMMYVTNLPTSDFIEKMMSGDSSLDCQKVSTSINLFKDALHNKVCLGDAVSEENIAFFKAIQELIVKTVPLHMELMTNYKKALELTEEIAKKHNLSELTQIKGSYSLSFAITLVANIEDFPGYSYPMVVDFFRQSNPEMSELMMATIFGRMYSENIHSAAFEFRDWWKEQDKKMSFPHPDVENKLQELRQKYNLPEYFEA